MSFLYILWSKYNDHEFDDHFAFDQVKEWAPENEHRKMIRSWSIFTNYTILLSIHDVFGGEKTDYRSFQKPSLIRDTIIGFVHDEDGCETTEE